MDTLYLWGLFVAIGIGTYLIRLSFVQLQARSGSEMAGFQTILKLLPPAILAALCVPPILYSPQGTESVIDTSQLLAAVITVVLTLKCRSVLWPILGGMMVLWISRWLGF